MRIGEKCVMKDLVAGDRACYKHSKEEFLVVKVLPPDLYIVYYPNHRYPFGELPNPHYEVEYLGKGKLIMQEVVSLEQAAKSLNNYLRKIRAAWYAVGITNDSLVVYYDGLPNSFDTWESFPVSWVKTEIPGLN